MAWEYLPKNAKERVKDPVRSRIVGQIDLIDLMGEKGNLKYHNKKVELDGIIFDSKKEAERYVELLYMQNAGEIKDLQRQVRFTLIPSQREKIVKEDGTVKDGKVLERECAYIADFVYKTPNGETVVEDTKSPATRTAEYRIKKKLMLYMHKIRVVEV